MKILPLADLEDESVSPEPVHAPHMRRDPRLSQAASLASRAGAGAPSRSPPSPLIQNSASPGPARKHAGRGTLHVYNFRFRNLKPNHLNPSHPICMSHAAAPKYATPGTERIKRRGASVSFTLFLLCLLVSLIWSPTSARANCTISGQLQPSYPQGAIQWFTSDSTYKLCDGTNWNTINLDTVSQGACSPVHGRKYDPTLKAYKVCDPTSNYKKINCVTGAGGNNGGGYCLPAQATRLRGEDTVNGDGLGMSVSLSSDGNTAVLGAPYHTVGSNSNQGAVYVFGRNSTGSWVQQAELTASDGAVNDEFGWAVAISGDGKTILVGAPDAMNGTGASAGTFYIFVRSGPAAWTLQKEVKDGWSNPFHLGYSTALSADGNTALIGVNVGSYTWYAYVYKRSGSVWNSGTLLTSSDQVAGDEFGTAVALSADGNTALIGAYNHTVGGNSGQGTAYVFTNSGGTWSQQAELTASDGAMTDWFGYSVALSGDGNTALIGADNKTIGSNSDQGAAYVFTNSGGTWTQSTKLTASDGAASDYFGGSVSLNSDGSVALIGAYGKTVGSNSGQGMAYAFALSGSTWTQGDEFTSSDAASGGRFGNSVSLNSGGNIALVGAYSNYAGYVHFLTQEVTSSDGAASDKFGSSAALSGDGNTALIAAPRKTVNGNSNQGAVYAFTRSGTTWTQAQILTASDGAANDAFGGSASASGFIGTSNGLALSNDGNTALIGAPGKAAVYYFSRSGSTWTQTQKLTPSDGTVGFGSGVALSSDGATALIGADASSNGEAYIFTRSGSTWTQASHFQNSDPQCCIGSFGFSVAFSGNLALVGDPNMVVGGNGAAGAVYVFDISNPSSPVQDAKIPDPAGLYEDFFGASVALSGNIALIGQPGGTNHAYVYDLSTPASPVQDAQISPPDGGAAAEFGNSVALSSDAGTALIGAFYQAEGGVTYSGAAYVFDLLNPMSPQSTEILSGFDKVSGDYFGYAVAISSYSALIAAPRKTVSGNTYQGAAYFYDFPLSCSPLDRTALGTGNEKTATSPWTALSSVTLNAGDALLVCISSFDTVTGVTWNGTSMTQDATAGTPGTTGAVYIYSLPNATAGTGNIVVTLSGASTKGKALTATAFSDLATSSMLDQTSAATGSSTGPSSGATATTTAANELLFGCLSANGPVGDPAEPWGYNFTDGQRDGTTGGSTTSNMTAHDGYKTVGATGNYTATNYLSISRAWQTAIATYKIITSGTSCAPYGACTTPGQMDYSAGSGMYWCNGSDWLQMKAP
jgi:FG-GAP repeat